MTFKMLTVCYMQVHLGRPPASTGLEASKGSTPDGSPRRSPADATKEGKENRYREGSVISVITYMALLTAAHHCVGA